MKNRNCLLAAFALLLIVACGIIMAATQTISVPLLGDLSPEPKSVITGSGNVTSEAREVSGVDSRVVLKAPGELIITQGDTKVLTIEAEDNLLGLIQTRIENGSLVVELSTEPNVSLQLNKPIRYLLTIPKLTSLEVAGAGGVQALSVQTEDLKVNLSGGGKIVLAGRAGSQDVEIDGSGIYQAGDLESKNVNLNANGSIDATIWAADRLNVTCKGACSVKYYGSPELGKDITAVGVVTSLGEK